MKLASLLSHASQSSPLLPAPSASCLSQALTMATGTSPSPMSCKERARRRLSAPHAARRTPWICRNKPCTKHRSQHAHCNPRSTAFLGADVSQCSSSAAHQAECMLVGGVRTRSATRNFECGDLVPLYAGCSALLLSPCVSCMRRMSTAVAVRRSSVSLGVAGPQPAQRTLRLWSTRKT